MNPKLALIGSHFLLVVFLIFGWMVYGWTNETIDSLADSLTRAGMPDAQVKALQLHLPSILSPLRIYVCSVTFGLCMLLTEITRMIIKKDGRVG